MEHHEPVEKHKAPARRRLHMDSSQAQVLAVPPVMAREPSKPEQNRQTDCLMRERTSLFDRPEALEPASGEKRSQLKFLWEP